MPTPFVFVTTHRIKPGGREQFAALHREYVRFVEEHEPRLLGHFTYLTQDGTEVSLLQLHPDAASADQHLEVVAPRLAVVGDIVENTAIEVYGDPGPRVRAALDRNRDAGVAVRITNQVLGGFSRL
jgi:hypothetical protein